MIYSLYWQSRSSCTSYSSSTSSRSREFSKKNVLRNAYSERRTYIGKYVRIQYPEQLCEGESTRFSVHEPTLIRISNKHLCES